MTHLLKLSIWILVGLSAMDTWAAPTPMLNPVGTKWAETPVPPDLPQILTLYRTPLRENGEQATFSVRLDRSAADFNSLEGYSKKWAKEFPRFGYEVLTARDFDQNGEKGFVFDLVHRPTQKQARQIVFFRKTGAAVLTCTDRINLFADTGAECDKLIKTFRWSEN